MIEKIYLLFPIIKGKFNPALVGVFLDRKIAVEAERKLYISHPDHTTSFILEAPMIESLNEYETQWSDTILNQMRDKIRK